MENSIFIKTIFALATGKVGGALSIIRISGKNAFNVLDYTDTKKQKSNFYLSKLYNYKKTKVIDEIVVLKYKNPNSFTGEDVVELICHSNKLIVDQIYELCSLLGFDIAQRGEFSKRAFLNGKIDLLKAESINELITSQNIYLKEKYLDNVLNFSTAKIVKIIDEIVLVAGNIEISIDYPEYNDTNGASKNDITNRLFNIKKTLNDVLLEYDTFTNIKDDPRVAIVGQPNCGKSLLFNRIIKKDQAIVSDTKGTTRDYLEKEIHFKKNNFIVIDTAGLREVTNKIEKIGISKTKELMSDIDNIIYLVDSTTGMTKQDKQNISKLQDKNINVFFNKKDLIKKTNYKPNIKYISAKKDEIIPIYDFLKTIIATENKDTNKDVAFIFTNRHMLLIKEAQKNINEVLLNLKNQTPLEIISININEAYKKLSEIISPKNSEKLIDKIFDKFCLGK